MNARNLLTTNAIFVGIVSLISIFLPTFFLETNGVKIFQDTINLQRIFGAVSIGYAIISWMMREFQASKTRGVFMVGSAANYFILTTVMIVNNYAIHGLEPNISWSYLVINLLFGFAFLKLGRKEIAG